MENEVETPPGTRGAAETPTGKGAGRVPAGGTDGEADPTDDRVKIVRGILVPICAVAWWVVILALPSKEEVGDVERWAMAGLGTIGLIVGLVLVFGALGNRPDPHILRGGFGLGLAIFGALLLLAAWLTGNDLEITAAERFAVGVGGLAIMAFAYGVLTLDTIRAAASLPVIILFIGAATWPNSTDVMDPEIRTTILEWSAILLGVSGAAEAAKQIGESNAQAKSGSAEMVQAAGDLDNLG